MNHFTPQCAGQELALKTKKQTKAQTNTLIICCGISATSQCTETASKWSLCLFALFSFSNAVCSSIPQLKKKKKRQKKAQDPGQKLQGKCCLLVTINHIIFSIYVCESFKSSFGFVSCIMQLQVPSRWRPPSPTRLTSGQQQQGLAQPWCGPSCRHLPAPVLGPCVFAVGRFSLCWDSQQPLS